MAGSQSKGLFREAAIQITSGGSAGLVEICIMYPLDLVKTRFQLQTPGAANQYTSIVDCFRKTIAKEGFKSLYKGILPPILSETPKRAIKFFTFEQYKNAFAFDPRIPAPVTFSLAGLCSGLTEGVIINPFEAVKVKMQASTQAYNKQPSSFTVAKTIIRESGFGLKGLNIGLTSTLMRHGVFNMVYFGFYHSMKDIGPKFEKPSHKFAKSFSVGFTSGVLACCFNIPFDVAKSRIQAQKSGNYKGCFSTVTRIYKEEGFRALYKGLAPKVLRLGPGGAIMFLVYEHLHAFLSETF